MDDTTKRPAFNRRDDGPAPNAGRAEAPTEVQDVTETDDWDEEDTDLLPAEGRRLWNRWTIGLVATVLMVTAFGVGALVQRQTGTDTTQAAAAFPQGGTGRFGSEGQGLPSGGQGLPGGGALPSTSQGQGGTAGTPAVVGQVVSVSGNTMTVKNFAGATVRVTVPEGTTVSVTSGTPLSGLQAGTTVSVTGTRGSDGTVSATGVTARAAAK